MLKAQAKGRDNDYQGRDNRMHFVYKRPSDHIVRFTEYHPSTNPEGFFYNLLLDHDACHFRSESKLISPSNKAGTFLTECYVRGIIKSKEHLEELVRQHGERQMFRDDQIGQVLARLQSMFDGDQLLQLGADAEEAPLPGEDGGEDEDTVQGLPTAEMMAEDFQLPADGGALKDDQQRVFEKVAAMEGGFTLITGGPGSGKTYLTQRLALHFRRAGRKVLFSASTGAAAMRLSRFASTNHATFHIPVRGPIQSLPPQHLSYSILRTAQVLFLDEM